MRLDAIIRSIVQIADRVTKSGQVTVQHKAFVSRDKASKPTHAPTAVPRQAIVEYKTRYLKDAQGNDVLATARVMILANVPVNNEDLITLPNGKTAPILSVGPTVLDPTGGGYYAWAWLGQGA